MNEFNLQHEQKTDFKKLVTQIHTLGDRFKSHSGSRKTNLHMLTGFVNKIHTKKNHPPPTAPGTMPKPGGEFNLSSEERARCVINGQCLSLTSLATFSVFPSRKNPFMCSQLTHFHISMGSMRKTLLQIFTRYPQPSTPKTRIFPLLALRAGELFILMDTQLPSLKGSLVGAQGFFLIAN